MTNTSNIKSIDINSFSNPYVIFYNGIGDHFMVLPTIRALSAIFDGNLSLICHEGSYACDIFCNIPFKRIIEIYFYEEDGERHFDITSLLPQMTHCDLLISLNPWGGKLDIVDLLNSLQIKHSVGFFDCFSVKVPFYFKKHNIELNFDIALAIDNRLNIEDFTYEPELGEDFQHLRKRLRSLVPDDVKVLALHTDTELEKMWYEDNYAELLEELLGIFPDIGVIIVGRRQLNVYSLSYADRILQFSDRPLPFKIAYAFVSIADFFLGIDSVFLHVADLYRIPSVGLFGPTSPIEFGFKYSPSKHIYSESRSMSDISVSEVVQAMSSIIMKENYCVGQ